MLDDGIPSNTEEDQRDLERKVSDIYCQFLEDGIGEDNEKLRLKRRQHAKYLYGGLCELPAGFSSLDASRTWIVYWIAHSLALLEQPLPSSPSRSAIIQFLAQCQHSTGGFGGGPFQIPHLATTYASVSALVTIGGTDALSIINRESLEEFFLRMCVSLDHGGGMTMHQGGEIDVRGCYCALAVCRMLCIDTDKISKACALEHFVARCQSFEGGIGGEPWNEAHGGYTFCGFAALCISRGLDVRLHTQTKSNTHSTHYDDDNEKKINTENDKNIPKTNQHTNETTLPDDQSNARIKNMHVDADKLLRWACRMQGWMEGGFMGRTNKLVDGCYSFWQGGIFPLLSSNALISKNRGGGPSVLYTARETDPPPSSTSSSLSVDELRVMDALLDEKKNARFQHVSQHQTSSKLISIHEILAEVPLSAVDYANTVVQERIERNEEKEFIEAAQEHAYSAKCAATQILCPSICMASPSRSDTAVQHAMEENPHRELYDTTALQLWLLACCQGIKGGMKDKPGKGVDYYHTCYCLSGLSSAQHYSLCSRGVILGGEKNILARADALCNVVESKLNEAHAYFTSSSL